LFIKSYKNCRI